MKKLLTCLLIILASSACQPQLTEKENKEKIGMMIRVAGYKCDRVISVNAKRKYARNYYLREVNCETDTPYYIKNDTFFDKVWVCYEGKCKEI